MSLRNDTIFPYNYLNLLKSHAKLLFYGHASFNGLERL